MQAPIRLEPSAGTWRAQPTRPYRLIMIIFALTAGGQFLLRNSNTGMALVAIGEIADRGYVLERGRVVLEGDRDEILHEELVRKAYPVS